VGASLAQRTRMLYSPLPSRLCRSSAPVTSAGIDASCSEGRASSIWCSRAYGAGSVNGIYVWVPIPLTLKYSPPCICARSSTSLSGMSALSGAENSSLFNVLSINVTCERCILPTTCRSGDRGNMKKGRARTEDGGRRTEYGGGRQEAEGRKGEGCGMRDEVREGAQDNLLDGLVAQVARQAKLVDVNAVGICLWRLYHLKPSQRRE
jgi:hypothetical protein